MLRVTHSTWSGTNLSPRFHRASSVLPELISLAVLQSLSLFNPRELNHPQPTPFHTSAAGGHTGRMRGHRLTSAVSRAGMGQASSELPQDGAGSPGCRGRAPAGKDEAGSRLSWPSPGRAAAAGWQQPPAGEEREQGEEEETGREGERGGCWH